MDRSVFPFLAIDVFFARLRSGEGHLGNDIWLLTVFSYAERASAVQRFSLQSFKMMLGLYC